MSESTTQTIEQILTERDNNYGSFEEHARITQALKNAISNSKNYYIMTSDKREALDRIVHKIGRILSGNPEYKDSWTDIIGYAKLVEQTLK